MAVENYVPESIFKQVIDACEKQYGPYKKFTVKSKRGKLYQILHPKKYKAEMELIRRMDQYINMPEIAEKIEKEIQMFNSIDELHKRG